MTAFDRVGPNGLGVIEQAILTTLLRLEATETRRQRTSQVAHEIADEHGLHPAACLPVLHRLGQPWAVTLPLLTFRGNGGSLFDVAAEPHYTEIGLTPLGLHAALAITGERPALPLGPLLGDLWAGGLRPSFSTIGIVSALRAIESTANIHVAELARIVGPPVWPTAPAVSFIKGDLSGLLSARPCWLQLQATAVEEGGEVVIDGLNPNVGNEPLAHLGQLAHKIARQNGLDRLEPRDRTSRLFLRNQGAAIPPLFVDDLLARWPFKSEVRVKLDRPLRTTLSEYLSRWAPDDRAIVYEILTSDK